MDYSVKFVFFTLSGLKVKKGGCRVKFVKVYEWFVGYDRLKNIFKWFKYVYQDYQNFLYFKND